MPLAPPSVPAAEHAGGRLDRTGWMNNPMPTSHRLKWAGNHKIASLVELPGLAAWVYSVPAGPGEAGGDVHYVSVCPS